LHLSGVHHKPTDHGEMEREKEGLEPQRAEPEDPESERSDVIYDLTGGSAGTEVEAKSERDTTEGVESEIDRLRRERDEYFDQYLRAMADLENMKKRVARERAEYERYATENLLRELLTVVDNLRRAIDVGRECHDFEPFFEGVELISRQVLELLEKEDLQLFHSVGEEFDPSRHDAIYTVESDEHPPDTIVEELAPGYLIGERVLRPAQVVVSKAKQESVPDGSGGPGDAAEENR
jgi:molecular chaperone GrpE